MVRFIMYVITDKIYKEKTMKKKFAALLIALSCALTCAPALAACNDTSTPSNPPDTGDTLQTSIAGEYKFSSMTAFDYDEEKNITVNAGETIYGVTVTEDYMTLSVKPDFTLALTMPSYSSEGEEATTITETAEWAYFKGDYIVFAQSYGSIFRNNYEMTYNKNILTINFGINGMGNISFRQVEKNETKLTIPYKYPTNVEKPTLPKDVQLQDVDLDSTEYYEPYHTVSEMLGKISESKNASAYCVAKLTDYGTSPYGILNTIVSTTGYVAADGYSAFYDYAYNSEHKRHYNVEEEQYESYLKNYVSGCYALEHDGKQYGSISNIQFDSNDANSVKKTNKYFYSEGLAILSAPGCDYWRNNPDLLKQRFNNLDSMNLLSHFVRYSSIYNYDNYDIYRLISDSHYADITTVEQTIQANESKLFISHVIKVGTLFEYELTFYADADAKLTASDVEKQLNENSEGFSGTTAQKIIDKYTKEFPHATFDKQVLNEKLTAGEKAEIGVLGSSENLIIIGNEYLIMDTQYLENWQFLTLNSLEDGKVIIDGGAKMKYGPSEDLTVGEYLQHGNLISIYIADTSESEQTIYVYAYDING